MCSLSGLSPRPYECERRRFQFLWPGGGHFHREISRDPEFEAIACPGQDVTHDDVVQVFVTFAQENPQFMEQPAMDVLFRAVGTKWPC